MFEDLHLVLNQIRRKDVLIEVRLDNTHDDLKDLFRALDTVKDRLILTVRTRGEGGFFMGDDEGLREKYLEIIDYKPLFIDIEINSKIFEEVAKKAKDNSIKVIASFHDPFKTPSKGKLRIILETMIESPYIDVAKIVTMARSYKDNLTVLGLLERYSGEKPLIMFCMGRYGKISRIMAPLLGSWLTYVSIHERKTAPGQLTLEEMEMFLRWLK
jgi:3-dehydroquinate dehydratase type I